MHTTNLAGNVILRKSPDLTLSLCTAFQFSQFNKKNLNFFNKKRHVMNLCGEKTIFEQLSLKVCIFTIVSMKHYGIS